LAKSIVGITNSRNQVEDTVDDLQSAVSSTDISLLMPESGGTPELGAVKATKAPEGATTGAVAGGAIGGIVGLLPGIGSLAIPGLGPFIAAGPIMAPLSGAAAGAATGGAVGALVGLGTPEYEAKAYEERIKEGGYLIAVHAENGDRGDVVRDIMKRNGLEDVSQPLKNSKRQRFACP
jgi:uncharacterized membrane protein